MNLLLLALGATLLGFLLIALTRERPTPEESPDYEATDVLEALERLPQDDFEAVVVELIERVGLRFEGLLPGRSEMVELVAGLEGPIIGGRYLIQAVRPAAQNHVLDSLMVQYLYEVTREQGVQKAVLITTGVFTARARELAADKGLELIDGAQFSELLERHQLSLSQDGAFSRPVGVREPLPE